MKKLIVLLTTFMLLSISCYAQTRLVKGTVVDKSGLGLPGVSVSRVGKPGGAITNIDGKWKMKVSNDDILEFSFMGMVTQKVKVGIQKVINIVMKDNRVLIDEVMVVAYGTADKESYTGSASVVSDKEVLRSSGSVAKKIQGNVAGVQVMGESVRIRGFGSLDASSSPLYVVDGVIDAPYPNDEEIQSISVLKDASSTALYGSRGANGVIIISTKLGERDTNPMLTVKYEKTVEKLIEPDWDIMDASQYFKLHLQGANYDYDDLMSNIKFNPYNINRPYKKNSSGKWELDSKAKLLYNSDWKNRALKMASKDEVFISMQGGSSKANYSVSAKAYNYNGNISPINSKGINSRFNLKADLNDRITLSINASVKYSEGSTSSATSATETNHLYLSYVLSPVAPIYSGTRTIDPSTGNFKYVYRLDENGNKIWDWTNYNYQDYNPLALMEMDKDNSYYYTTFISPTLEVKLIDGMTYIARGAGNITTNKGSYWQNPFHGSGQTEKGLSQRSTWHARDWTFLTSLNYKFRLGDNNFNMFLGFESNKYTYESFYGEAKGYPIGDLSTELSSGSTPKEVGSSTTETSMLSYISNFEYNFHKKYFITASFRRDGSSKFGPNNRWGNFWSLGWSWRISEESFLLDIPWMNNLKFRGSYGVLGTNAVNSYQYGNYFSFGANYGGRTGIVHTGLPNINLGWEQSNNLSVGVDFDLFYGSRLSGTIEWYYRNTDGLLFDVPTPITTGFNSILKNIGEMYNTGYEFSLKGKILTGSIKWNANATISTVYNEITSMPVKRSIFSTKIWEVGGSRYDFYLKEWAGVNPDNGDPLWFCDKSSGIDDVTGKKMMIDGRYVTNRYSHAPKYKLGKSVPSLYWGFTNTFELSGFDFSFQFIGASGHKIYDGRYKRFMHDGSSKLANLSTDALNAWTPENRHTEIPRFRFANTNKSASASSRWLVNGAFIKLKNISMGYTFPHGFCDSLGIDSFRLYTTFDNIFSISDYKSGDPEISFSGKSYGYTLPTSLVMRFGLSINF
ncbi:SusC/RagA family TonB-linked outer membrane protein [Marinilabiliaceae bacterium JC040]|nr:SusC/RagA family TonB-linked outer membrane protein [Marinilabiliaceae bacterium JC040]